jgi:hypothetical protein
MEQVIQDFTNIFTKKITEINEEYNSKTIIIEEKDNIIKSLTDENSNLKKKLNEMIEEKKLKLSSTLWENTQLQLKEKDLIIEGLKKEIEYYKRNQDSNILLKYPHNDNKNKQKNNIVLENNKLLISSDTSLDLLNNKLEQDNIKNVENKELQDNLTIKPVDFNLDLELELQLSNELLNNTASEIINDFEKHDENNEKKKKIKKNKSKDKKKLNLENEKL